MSAEGSNPNLIASSKGSDISESPRVVTEDIGSVEAEDRIHVAQAENTGPSEADTSSVIHSTSTESSGGTVSASNEIDESADSFKSAAESLPKRRVSFASRVAGDEGEVGAGGTAISGRDANSEVVGAETEESSDEPANRGCCPEHRGPVGFFRIKMMYLRQSKYLLPFKFLLLGMPVSSGFMGAGYMYKCPASPAIPILFFMMGIIGTVFLCARIYTGFRRALFPHTNPAEDDLPLAGSLLLAILYTTELACFFNMDVDFTSNDTTYCDETFYRFASYMNYASLVLVLFLVSLHCPGRRPCCCARSYSPPPIGTHDLLGGLD